MMGFAFFSQSYAALADLIVLTRRLSIMRLKITKNCMKHTAGPVIKPTVNIALIFEFKQKSFVAGFQNCQEGFLRDFDFAELLHPLLALFLLRPQLFLA
jgi:hypothetical protein